MPGEITNTSISLHSGCTVFFRVARTLHSSLAPVLVIDELLWKIERQTFCAVLSPVISLPHYKCVGARLNTVSKTVPTCSAVWYRSDNWSISVYSFAGAINIVLQRRNNKCSRGVTKLLAYNYRLIDGTCTRFLRTIYNSCTKSYGNGSQELFAGYAGSKSKINKKRTNQFAEYDLRSQYKLLPVNCANIGVRPLVFVSSFCLTKLIMPVPEAVIVLKDWRGPTPHPVLVLNCFYWKRTVKRT